MYVTKINQTKILPLNTKFIVPVIIANMASLLNCEPNQKLPVLPDLKGSLSEKVPSSSIDLINYINYNILDKKTIPNGKCGEYFSLTSAQKFLNWKMYCRRWSNSNE